MLGILNPFFYIAYCYYMLELYIAVIFKVCLVVLLYFTRSLSILRLRIHILKDGRFLTAEFIQDHSEEIDLQIAQSQSFLQIYVYM